MRGKIRFCYFYFMLKEYKNTPFLSLGLSSAQLWSKSYGHISIEPSKWRQTAMRGKIQEWFKKKFEQSNDVVYINLAVN